MEIKIKDYKKFIEEAKFFVEELKPWKKYDRNNDNIFYSIDTNIIALYTNPKIVIERDINLFNIFYFDDIDIHLLLARSISMFLFNAKYDVNNFVLFKPTAIELSEMLLAVSYRAKLKEKKIIDIEEKFETIKKKIELYSNDDSLVEYLIRDQRQILDTLIERDGTPRHELMLFKHLIDTKRILSIDYIRKFNADYSRYNSLLNAYSDIDPVEYSICYKKWKDLLKNQKHKSLVKINYDAEVLANIELINKNLYECHDSRLVFLTTDRAIQSASKQYNVSSQNDSFYNLYIRTPRSYIAELGLYLNIKNSKELNDDIDLYELLLIYLGVDYYNNNSNHIKADIFTKDSDKNFINEWTNIIQSLSAQYMIDDKFSKLKFKQLTKELVRKLRSNSVRKIFYENNFSNYNSFLEHAADKAASVAIYNNINSYPYRSVPYIKYREFPDTDKYVKRIFKQNPTELNYKFEKEQLNLVKNEDLTRYSYYLAVGLLFFSDEKFETSKALAHRALRVSANLSNKKIQGHEAAYLLAVSSRLTTKTSKDLYQVKLLIDYAYERIKIYENIDEGIDFIDIRYECEKISIVVTQILFNIFLHEPLAEQSCLCDLNFIMAEISKLIDTSNMEIDFDIKNKVQKQLLANYFQILILQVFYFKNEDINYNENYINIFRDLMPRNLLLDNNADHNFYYDLSHRVKLFYIMSEMFFGNKYTIEHLHSEFFKSIKDNLKKIIMPYDKVRFEFFINVVESFCSKFDI